jgi:hypothetical protein
MTHLRGASKPKKKQKIKKTQQLIYVINYISFSETKKTEAARGQRTTIPNFLSSSFSVFSFIIVG